MESSSSTNEPEKFDIKAESNDFSSFIAALKSTPEITQTAYTPSDEKNHFVIYRFLLSGGKCSVVYDTKAGIISLTAKSEMLERFKQLYIRRDSVLLEHGGGDKQQTSAPQRKPNLPQARKPAPLAALGGKDKRLPAEHKQQIKAPVKKEAGLPISQKKQTPPVPEPKQTKAPVQNKPEPKAKKQDETVVSREPEPEYKNGYAIKKYSAERMKEVLKRIKATRGMSYKIEPTTNKGKPDEAQTYIVTSFDNAAAREQKVILRYMPKKQILQMQGKRSYLFSDVQVLVLKDEQIDERAALRIEAQTDSGKQSVANMQKRLKRDLKDAFDFLSEQSKLDLTIGFIDINSGSTLFDYSSLLTPPYRGLEKFIKDLQLSKGIEVKMIGQGYEKDENGNYRLKLGYRKKIDSIVYDEVMSALYTEYFARRNFYTHSDFAGDGAPRIISDRQEVKKIFDRLIYVINYNAKKLKEIGFTMKK